MSFYWKLGPDEDSCEEHVIWESGMPPPLNVDSRENEVKNQPHQVDPSLIMRQNMTIWSTSVITSMLPFLSSTVCWTTEYIALT